jgi:hypothetical protein
MHSKDRGKVLCLGNSFTWGGSPLGDRSSDFGGDLFVQIDPA